LGELGAGPLALARAQRAQTARILIETTSLAMAQVAFGAGFASIRQFNDTVRLVFGATPTELRAAGARRRDRSPSAAPSVARGTISLRLPFRHPYDATHIFDHLARTAVPGCEDVRDRTYRRTLRLAHGVAVVTLGPTPDFIAAHLRLDDTRDLPSAIARCRRLLDLDADPEAVDAALLRDRHLRDAVAKHPGIRVPRTTDEAEFAMRAVVGQQISTSAARRLTQRLVEALGTPLDHLTAADPEGRLTHVFPTPDQMAEVEALRFAGPPARQRCLAEVARRLAAGALDVNAGSDWQEARAALARIQGVGPWTVEMIAMRGLGDPDAFPAADAGIRRGAIAAGIAAGMAGAPKGLVEAAQHWRPWRAYAAQHLIHSQPRG
jgi:AraC family transcriptional regulator of adaptative response / DNA-3-methyladenine glycosylase II